LIQIRGGKDGRSGYVYNNQDVEGTWEEQKRYSPDNRA
jgi:hypothetical protein